MQVLTRISAFALTIALATPAWAQDVAQAPATGQQAPDDEEFPDDAIVVTGERVRGQVQTDVPPVVELDEADIAAYGADSLADLIEQLAPQTGSASGRGSGRPVFLVNGRRVSSFREFRRYPPEAIVKVEVFPEEVALQYGYPADQRVVNFILKDNFASREVEVEYGQPTAGGRSSGELEYSQLTINGGDRLLLGAELTSSSMLTEAERGIVQTEDSIPTIASDPDPAEYRSLASDSEGFELETTWNTSFGEGARAPALSINGNLDRSFSRSLSGLDTVLLTDSDGNSELRVLDADPITRRTSATTASLGSSFNAPVGDWNLALTLDAARSWSTSQIDRRRDTSALADAAAAGELDITGDLGGVPDAGFDEARSKTYTIDTLATLTGQPILLPSGEVNVTAKAGYKLNGIESTDTRNEGPETSLNRRRAEAGLNLGIPLASAREDFLAPLGELGLDLGGGIEHLSDFGTLTNWNAGLNWRPSQSLSLQASYTVREAAPSLTQLGAPQIVDVNVPVFDITTGDTVLANVVTGGNPDLLAETQRDIRLSASYDFDLFDRSNFRVEYVRNRSEDVTESFPVLTPAIEAAFPDRVTRVNGQLVELDRRPVTFAERNSSRIQYGFNFFGKVGKPAPQSDGGGRRGGLMARVGAAAGQASTPGQAREGQGRGGFDTERFAQIRAQFCQEGTEPDIAQLPERMQQRLRDENGQIDPARVAQMRERFCSADGAPDPQRMAAMRQTLCTGWNAADPSASTPPDLSALPERFRQRLTGPDGQIDQARVNQLRSRVCAAPEAAAQNDGDQAAAGNRGGGRQGGGGGRRGGSGGFGRGGDGQGRWNLSLYHTIELENSALIAPGIPELDLLDGDALSGSGVNRHTVTMEGGLFYKGMGLRLSGNYASGSRVDTLTFHDLATFDARLFMNLEEQKWLTGETPGFFKGARLSLRVDNLFDAHQRVTDEAGIVPLSYQPDLVDPLGRTFEIEFRKVF
jgi:hypothetical protein